MIDKYIYSMLHIWNDFVLVLIWFISSSSLHSFISSYQQYSSSNFPSQICNKNPQSFRIKMNDLDDNNQFHIHTFNQILAMDNYRKFCFLIMNHFKLRIHSHRIDNLQLYQLVMTKYRIVDWHFFFFWKFTKCKFTQLIIFFYIRFWSKLRNAELILNCLKWIRLLGLFLYTIYFVCPFNKKSAGVRSGDLAGQPIGLRRPIHLPDHTVSSSACVDCSHVMFGFSVA
jgi:hypothetical protein